MKYFRNILFVVLMALVAIPAFAQEAQAEEKGGVNLKEILFGHVQDAYQWHITDFNGHPVIINLPIIFYSSHSGFHVMCSSQFSHEPDANLLRKGPDGFFIQGAEDEKGRIVEQGTHDELIAKKQRYYQLYTGMKSETA